MNKKRAFIPMSVLIGALLLALVAAMTPFVAEPNVAHAQTPTSADATLGNLGVVGGSGTAPTPPGGVTYSALSPTLDTDATDGLVTEYAVRIPFIHSGVTVTPTSPGTLPSGETQTIRVNGTTVASGADHVVGNLRAGMTTSITIQVTSPTRTVTNTYTVKVYRERQSWSGNTDLASLSLGGVSLSPSFRPGQTTYNARTQSGTVTVSYGLSDIGGGASASITAPTACADETSIGCTDGNKVRLGAAAAEDTATGGETTITVTVTPESGTDNNGTYTITVYRIRDNRATNANLATLTLTAVGGSRVGSAFTLDTDAADGITTSYMDRFDNATTHVTVAATVADAGATRVISPSDARAGEGVNAGHQVALRAGAETTITVTVTAEDTGRRQTYTVTVYRNRATLSDDADLTSLSLSAGTLTPAFDRDRLPYTTQVMHDVEDVTVSYNRSDTAGGSSVAVTADGGATVANNKVTLLAAGTTTNITVTVTAEDGTASNAYTIAVYRLRELPSANASLSGLAVAPGTLAPTFAATTKNYNVSVNNTVASITVTPTAADAASGATVVTTPKGGVSVDLTAGMATVITITVTAEDRTTSDVYTVTVYRQRADTSDDATLSALSLSVGMLSPSFNPDTTEYKARVANSVRDVTVSATPNDNAGGVGVAVAATNDADTPVTCDGSATTCDVDGMKVTLEEAAAAIP